MRVSEVLGFAGGALLAPLAAAGSFLRRGRIFHPDGVVYRAEVMVDPTAEGAARDVALRLAGPALVRLSSALYREKGGQERRPDLLGASIRFRHDPAPIAAPGPGDQGG